ncbi:ogr/Delta-like zinc finger family protein [Aquitalea sp. ASV11]|uniref:ogr/Delta-like zinc finger family protein n=1 Tax=Aquitalea sp. ASV11 TaxID=2795103 RepID=UPI0018EE3300|nr:ogr/Delta-like zinc finger family protein [Aquitalea sp. ASV11]
MTAPTCPACGESALITRTSRAQSAATREVYAQCKVCGVQLHGWIEWTSRLADGLLPPDMHRAKLPMSPAAERQRAFNMHRAQRRSEPDKQLQLGID